MEQNVRAEGVTLLTSVEIANDQNRMVDATWRIYLHMDVGMIVLECLNAMPVKFKEPFR